MIYVYVTVIFTCL